MDLEGLYDLGAGINFQHGNTAEVNCGERIPFITMTSLKILLTMIDLLTERVEELTNFAEHHSQTAARTFEQACASIEDTEPPIRIEDDSWERLEKDWEESIAKFVKVSQTGGDTMRALWAQEDEKIQFHGRAIAMIMDHFGCSYIGASDAFDDAYDDFFQTHTNVIGLYTHVGKWLEKEDNDYFGEPYYK